MNPVSRGSSHTNLGGRRQPDTLPCHDGTDESLLNAAHEEDIFDEHKTQTWIVYSVGRHLGVAHSCNCCCQVRLSINAHTSRAGTHMSQ